MYIPFVMDSSVFQAIKKTKHVSMQVTAFLIEYVRVFKSLFITAVNALYTYDAHQFEALLIYRQMLLFFIEIGCTSKVLEMFKFDRVIVKTGLAGCPETWI